MTTLREFLYLNQDLVQQFLSQLEGGVYEEDSQVTRSAGGGKFKGGVDAGPVQAGVERGSQRSEERSRVVKQTAASQFDRLFRALDDNDGVQWLDNIDVTIWGQLRRGEIIEIDGVIRPAGISKIAELFSVFSELLPVMEAFTDSESVGDEEMNVVQGIRRLKEFGSPETTATVVTLASAPKFQFACVMHNRYQVVEPSVIEGEATVFGKVRRKLKPKERYAIPDVFAGLEAVLSAKERREMMEAFNSPQVKALGVVGPEIGHPGAVLTPIAIYR